MKRILLTVLLGVAALLLVGSIGFTAWAAAASEPMPEALKALEADTEVAISLEPWLVFQPADAKNQCGLIFYPGGRVDPRAYAPAARKLARQGITSVIVPMPLNLAFFAPNRAAEVMASFPEIDTWVMGGHSLGGSMAASFAASNPEDVSGLILLAAYPAGSSDLSDENMVVASIYGSRDGLVEISTIQETSERLPEDSQLLRIEGGNHAQFGWYGEQTGDFPASIAREDQQTQVVSSTLDVFQELGCVR